MEGIRGERGLLGLRWGAGGGGAGSLDPGRGCPAAGREGCSRGIWSTDMGGGGQRQTEDRGRLAGRGTPLGTPRNRGLYQVSWERDPVPRWKRGGRMGRHPPAGHRSLVCLLHHPALSCSSLFPTLALLHPHAASTNCTFSSSPRTAQVGLLRP